MKEKEIMVNTIDSDMQMPDLHSRVKGKASKRRRKLAKKPRIPMNPKKKKIMIISIIVGALLLLGLIVWGISRIGFNSENDPNILVDDIVEDKVSVLLVGSDGGGYNTDTMMLVMMDCKNHTLNILSIPRDTRVPNPYGGSGHAKINSVYTAKGMSGLIDQIGQITGLPINFYVKVDFEGFKQAIDTLGGVQFDVPMRLKYDDPAQDLHIDLQAGPQLLDGDKAEQLVRSRNQYPMADITRTEVQREFLKETIKQHATTGNLFKVGDLYNIMSKYVTTNITLGDALKYAPSLTKVSEENIQMFILPGTTDGTGMWLYDAAQMETLANDVFWYDVKIRPTPRPSSKPSNNSGSSSSTSTPAKTSTPKPDNDDDDDAPSTHTPTSTATAPPISTPNTPTPKPTASSTPKPTSTATPKPATSKPATPKPTTAPQTSHKPGDYPEGI